MVSLEEIVVKITGQDGLTPILARNSAALKNVNRDVATLGTSWKSNSAEMLKSRASVDHYNTSLQAAQKQITGGLTPAMMGINTGKLEQMGVHAVENQKKVQGLTSRFNGLKNTLNGLGGVLTGLIGLSLGAWIKNSIEKAKESHDSWDKLNSVLKDHGGNLKDAKKGIGDLADQYGFAAGEVREASRIFMQAGMSYQDMMKDQGTLKTAMALSIASSKPVSKSARDLQRAYQGNGKALQVLGLKINDYKDKTTGVVDANRLNADILEKTASQLEAHGHTYEAANMRFQRSLIGVQVVIGEKLLPYVIAYLDKASSLMKWFRDAPPDVHNLVAIVGGFAAVLMVVVPVLSMFSGNLKKVWGVGKKVGEVLKKVFTGKRKVDIDCDTSKCDLPDGINKGGKNSQKPGRIRRIISKIPGMERLSNLVSGLRGKLTSGLSKISSSLRSIPGKIASGLGKVSNSLRSGLSKIPGSLSKISTRLGSLQGKITSNLSKISSNLKSGLSKIPSTLNRISSRLGSGLGRVSSELRRISSTSGGGLGDLGGRGGRSGKGAGRFGRLTSKIPGVGRLGGIAGKLGGLGRLGGLASGAARFAGPLGVALTAATVGHSAYSGWNETKGPWQEKAKGAVGGAVESLSMGLVNKKQVMDGINWLHTTFKDLPGQIQAALGNLWQTITTPFQKAWDNAKSIVGQGVQIVQNFFKNLVDNARSILGRIWQIITSPFKRAWDNAKSIVGQGVQIVQNFFKNLVDNARSILGNILSVVTNPFRWALDTAKSIVSNGINVVIASFGSLPGKVGAWMKSAADTVKYWAEKLGGPLLDIYCKIMGCSPGLIPAFQKLGKEVPFQIGKTLPYLEKLNDAIQIPSTNFEVSAIPVFDHNSFKPESLKVPLSSPGGLYRKSASSKVVNTSNTVYNDHTHYHEPITINARDMSRGEFESALVNILEAGNRKYIPP